MHNAQTVTQRARPPVAGIIWGVVLNAVVPVVFYKLSKHYYSASEFTALVIAATFPLGKSAFELLIHRSFDPISIVVLLGITTDAVAARASCSYASPCSPAHLVWHVFSPYSCRGQ
jgi:hypothetical protein